MGTIYAKALITDDNYVLYESWCSIMSPVKHIINQRYIDNQIIEKLQTEIEDQDLQHEIYDTICAFFNAPQNSIKEKIISYTNDILKTNYKTKQFGIFFDHMFASRADMWAFCYLKESLNQDKIMDINTVYNQMLVLCENKKHFTSNLSKNMHIFFTELLDIQKNRKTKIDEINIAILNNHKNALCYNSTHIFPVTSDVWRIRLEDGTNTNFVTVTRKFCKIIDCTVKCHACNDICAHIYECSCNKGEINICEHVHMLGIFNKRIQNDIDERLKKDELVVQDLKTDIISKLKRVLSNINFVNDEETLGRISVSISRVENSVAKSKQTHDRYED